MPDLVGHWWHCHEHFTENFVSHDYYYQQFLPAYNARYVSAVIIQPCEDTLAFFAIELSKSRGVLTAEERDTAKRLGEHFRNALIAHHRIRSWVSTAIAGHELLRAFPYPMWLIDEDRTVAFENARGACETEAEARVGRRGSRLALVRSRADQDLTVCLHRLRQLTHGANAVIDMRQTTADPPTWLHLSLLSPSASLGAFGERPQVLVTLFDPNHVSVLDPVALANMFRLTPSEARVAVGLAEGLTAAQIGAKHGTAESTIRTQVGNVVAKLGVSRAVDVVRALRQGEALWARVGAVRGERN